MLTTDRECRRGGERFAMPTLGEIEGKLIVSEVVAANCLRQLLAGPETEPLSSIRRGIKQALQSRCKKSGLCGEDTDAAVEYAFQLLDAAVEAVGSNQSKLDSNGRESVHQLNRMAASPQ
ncbi:hypothetical protein QA646_24040 (plasmid) [Rhizobium sp. CB3090]|uniref:hypothetical protein n=1 Tax=Rhizobium sp. CB3090 TaxID=3039156 RepID=UPI0024B26BAB|nr:hypothetical protein [Rhizobium sp. CB3090]WFU11469.1 hypothetical protein QA646_24040 [Rhizobium sp. CB3090]